MTLIEFLRARLDDRHTRAAKLLRYAQENDAAVRDPRLLGRTIPGWHEWPEVEQMAREVLADIDTKRRIVDECERTLDVEEQGWSLANAVLPLLALPHADDPDYDPSWRLA